MYAVEIKYDAGSSNEHNSLCQKAEIKDNRVIFMREAGICAEFLRMNGIFLVERECMEEKEIWCQCKYIRDREQCRGTYLTHIIKIQYSKA